jgi:hypothetical protein
MTVMDENDQITKHFSSSGYGNTLNRDISLIADGPFKTHELL